MHPDLTYLIATLRREELLASRRFPAPAARRRRWGFRRRRDLAGAADAPPAPIVPLPPPREGADPAGHGRRVA